MPMRRMLVCFALMTLTAAAEAAPRYCDEVAAAIKNRLRTDAQSGLADRGAPASEADLAAFPLAAADREALKAASVRLARAGGARGLALIDAESGAAHCRRPLLFSLASGETKALAAPAPGDPLDRCGHGAVGLGAAGGRAFFLQSDGGADDLEQAVIFVQQGETLRKTCNISIRYTLEFIATDAFCATPDLCRLGPKAAVWARSWRTGGPELLDPAFSPAAAPKSGDAASVALPLAGAAAQTFAFEAPESHFAILGEPAADRLRIGAARSGPGVPPDATLVALYKGDRPVASFVVARRRGAAAVIAQPD